MLGGLIVPDKSGSNRIGWNQRGPSEKDQFKSALEQSGIANPDSGYWQIRTNIIRNCLAACMGDREFTEWAERLLPDDSIDELTWEEIHTFYDGKFQRVQAEIAMFDCHDWEDDPRHIKTNGIF